MFLINLKLIGKNIKKYRKAKGYTQAQLAEKISISTIHMSHLETGNVSMSVECLIKICDFLDVTPDNILLGEYRINDTSAMKQLSDISECLSCDDKKLLIDFAELLKNRQT